MDPEIEFGEMEQSGPEGRCRPDRDGRFVVQAVYQPAGDDLPIYVDFDVMREMMEHAASDRSVELGGVLLGGQFSDEQGQPFVMVTDCLRARHFESTKGSFKFTHDTWQQITREREQLPGDLQMVGWYHTHPDWGVFLSGLDLFICDHFFNKPLDVALVIDPCQLDTGFFQWTGSTEHRIRRTSGYFLFASRFRQDDLRDFIAALEGQVMPESTRSAKTPPVNVHFPPPPPPPVWQTLAVLGMLGMQFCLLVVLALRLLLGSTAVVATTQTGQAQNTDAVAADLRLREAAIDAKLQVLDTVLRHEGNLPDGVLDQLAERTQQVDELRGSLRGQQSLAKELDSKVHELEVRLKEVNRRDEESRSQILSMQTRLKELSGQLESEKKSEAVSKSRDARIEDDSWWSSLFADGRSFGFGAFLGASAAAVAGYVLFVRQPAEDPAPSDTPSPNDKDD